MKSPPPDRPPRLLPPAAGERICANPICKSPFGAITGGEKFCSQRCAVAPRPERNNRLRQCKHCGAYYEKYGGTVTCSDECATEHKAAQIRANNARQRERQRERKEAAAA